MILDNVWWIQTRYSLFCWKSRNFKVVITYCCDFPYIRKNFSNVGPQDRRCDCSCCWGWSWRCWSSSFCCSQSLWPWTLAKDDSLCIFILRVVLQQCTNSMIFGSMLIPLNPFLVCFLYKRVGKTKDIAACCWSVGKAQWWACCTWDMG